MWQIWLIAAGIFFIIEIATIGFLVFWFGIGALIAMVSSFFVSDVYIQSLIFIISSTCLIFFTKPFVKRFAKNEETVATNVYSIIGRKAIVTQDIDPILGTGQVKVSGEVWSAKPATEEKIPKDAEVEISAIDGVKAVVKLVTKDNVTI